MNSYNQMIILPYTSDRFRNVWELWKQYKKEQFKFTYKGNISEQAALYRLSKLAKDEDHAIELIQHSMGQGWRGIFPITKDNGKQKPNNADLSKAFTDYFANSK